jgi:hypothetical protein
MPCDSHSLRSVQPRGLCARAPSMLGRRRNTHPASSSPRIHRPAARDSLPLARAPALRYRPKADDRAAFSGVYSLTSLGWVAFAWFGIRARPQEARSRKRRSEARGDAVCSCVVRRKPGSRPQEDFAVGVATHAAPHRALLRDLGLIDGTGRYKIDAARAEPWYPENDVRQSDFGSNKRGP